MNRPPYTVFVLQAQEFVFEPVVDVSKLETGEMKLSVSQGNLLAQVRAIVQSFLSMAESKQIVSEGG